MKSTLQWWRLNEMFQTDDKLAYFGLKPNSYKENNLTTYTYYLPGYFQQNLEKSKKITYDKSQKKLKIDTTKKKKYVCNYSCNNG